jgi:hypothetical protein
VRITPVMTLAVLVAIAVSTPTVAADDRRLGKGYSWGRCLLAVGGKTLISGRCGYQIRKGGGFYMAGPRQVYEGVHYRNPGGFGAGQRSRDYWAVMMKEPDGSWYGYGNSDVRATHGDMVYRALVKQGACYVGEIDAGITKDGEQLRGAPVRLCLWKR